MQTRTGRAGRMGWMARMGGFTMIELVVTMVVVAIVAASVSVFIQPTVGSYFASQRRADLAVQADLAIRRMMSDVRLAVPNSLRIPSDQCFELVPTVGGGRYRMGPDVAIDADTCTASSGGACSAWVDPSGATTVFDALNIVGTAPAANDWVVIDNQNGNDVYTGSNRAAVTSVSTPASTQGVLRINIAGKQFHQGYAGGRFQVVSASEASVFYVCSGADGTLNANGDGKGTLYRLSSTGFNATYPSACPATTGAATVATQVKSCSFVYDANHGATQQSGFLWLDIELARNSESAHLAVGAHVANVP